jgi:HSP20 family protein
MKLTKAAPSTTRLTKPEFERFFDQVFAPFGFELPEMKAFETVWAPSMDVTETEKEFVVRVEAPGVHKENLDVNLEGNVLTVSGRREFRKEEENEEHIWREREEGKFIRSFRMPRPVQEGKVTAMYENGILTIRLLKTEPTVKTRIAIK